MCRGDGMKLKKALDVLIKETKSICKSSKTCENCELYNVCYYGNAERQRFQEFPHEILEIMRDELLE